MTTNLQIADWSIEIGMALPSLIASKYAPFYAERQKSGVESLLFALVQGEVALPNFTEVPIHKCDNGTEWNFYPQPDGVVVKLYIEMFGRTYWMKADKDWKMIVTDWKEECEEDAWGLDNIVMLSFVASSATKGTVLLHSSCVTTPKGTGVAFIGNSGAGKSTHSQLWLQYVEQCSLLNDDQPAVRLKDRTTPYIYGTPWSGKGDCYKQEKARLEAVYLMKQASRNRLTALDSVQAYAAVLSSVSIIKEPEEMMKGVLDSVAGIIRQTKVYELENRPEKESVALSANAIGIVIK